MDPKTFRTSIDMASPPDVSAPLLALWWDAKGDWTKAHECAQSDPGPLGAAVHAYLHRKEPDLANARYWYNRAGRAPATVSIEQEWDSLVTEFLAV
jgi:hypothetical protein